MNKNFSVKKDAWKNEWRGMPEFVQEDQSSHRKIVVHFRNDEDVKEFAKIINQRVTPKQMSLWFPYMPPRRYANKRYVDKQ